MNSSDDYPKVCRECERFESCSVRCGKGVKQWFSVPGEFSNQRYYRYLCPVEEEERVHGPFRRFKEEIRKAAEKQQHREG